MPDEIDGKKVIGTEDEYIVGGDLVCDVSYGGDGALVYSASELENAIAWIDSKRFEVTSELIQKLREAVKR